MMCKDGSFKEVKLFMPTLPPQRVITVKIDSCIAPLVQILNDYNIGTTESCCGHGRAKGKISLADGQIIWLPLAQERNDDDE